MAGRSLWFKGVLCTPRRLGDDVCFAADQIPLIEMRAVLRSEGVRDSSVRKGVDCKRNGDGRIVAGKCSSGPQLHFLTRWGARWQAGAEQGSVGFADCVSTA